MSITIDKLLVLLGYPKVKPSIEQYIIPSDLVGLNGLLVLTPERQQRLTLIVDDLSTIDGLLAEARANTMAINLGTMKLDFKTHLSALKIEATALLTELAQLTGVRLFWNRYLDEYPASQELYALFGIAPNTSTGYVATQW